VIELSGAKREIPRNPERLGGVERDPFHPFLFFPSLCAAIIIVVILFLFPPLSTQSTSSGAQCCVIADVIGGELSDFVVAPGMKRASRGDGN